ncbi:type I-F CRISPR-associated endoribonuclease Cas6/Csy4 [Betaproteobacteria bacterium]|nr:type I-F CRISPR-associated endoribonuclease Cas6/Csy4 [Betaproteobacteria bacterium]
MDHYLDIRIRPDPEFSVPQLMSALFAKLHLTLVDLQSTDIGISFPEVNDKKPSLGQRLRLHAHAGRLRMVVSHPHLESLRDHLEIAGPTPVPAQTQYRTVSRVQSDSNPERLRRRLIRRQNLSEAEARARIPDSAAKTLALPYLQLRSQSTGQHFRLFIQHGELQTSPVDGVFNSYGLSQQATIPWF